MNIPNSYVTKKEKYYIFLNVLKFEKYIVYVKYEYEYDKNVELLIYHLTL